MFPWRCSGGIVSHSALIDVVDNGVIVKLIGLEDGTAEDRNSKRQEGGHSQPCTNSTTMILL